MRELARPPSISDEASQKRDQARNNLDRIKAEEDARKRRIQMRKDAGKSSRREQGSAWWIKPLLAENYYACHGLDRDAQENDRRLDLPEHALQGAIDPGNPDSSEWIARIVAEDVDERMPPLEARKPPLSASQIGSCSRSITSD